MFGCSFSNVNIEYYRFTSLAGHVAVWDFDKILLQPNKSRTLFSFDGHCTNVCSILVCSF